MSEMIFKNFWTFEFLIRNTILNLNQCNIFIKRVINKNIILFLLSQNLAYNKFWLIDDFSVFEPGEDWRRLRTYGLTNELIFTADQHGRRLLNYFYFLRTNWKYKTKQIFIEILRTFYGIELLHSTFNLMIYSTKYVDAHKLKIQLPK